MISIFRSKQSKMVSKLLEVNGFNSADFKDFKMGEVAKQVVSNGLLVQFKQILKEQKMTHFKLLKASLIVLHILQISHHIQENPQIQDIIRELQTRTNAAMHYSRKPHQVHRRTKTYSDKKSHQKELECNDTAKQFCDSPQAQFRQNVQQNSVSYLLGKLVQPLLHIQEKVLFSHELIYKPKTKIGLQACWATLNLLKKFSELGRAIEEIGRYYQEYVIPMVCTIRVLSLDIRMLYRRLTDYLKIECGELRVAIELDKVSPTRFPDFKIKEIVMLVQELERINENVRQMYCNKYFSELLVVNHIFMPTIFSTGQENLEVIFSFMESKNKSPRRLNQCRVAGLATSLKMHKVRSLESVEPI